MPEVSRLSVDTNRSALGVSAEQQAKEASQEAAVGFWGDLAGSFNNGWRAQRNGLVQLSNKILGTSIEESKLARVDDPDKSWTAWSTSLAGQAGLMAFELFGARKIGAVAQFVTGAGTKAEVFAATQTAQSRMAHSLLFGAGLGGLMTPTDDPAHFWRDRFFNTVSSTASMASMTGLSLKLAATAAKIGSGSVATVLSNGFFNNAVGGIVGGGVGEAGLQWLHGQPFDWNHIGKASLEFGIVGSGAHGLNLATAAVYGRATGTRAGSDKPSLSDKADSADNPKNDPAPERLDRFPLTPEAKPFVEKIVEKFKIDAVSPAQVESIIKSFPAEKQPLAIKILDHSLPNSSEVWFADRMKVMREKLDPLLSSELNGNAHVAEEQASAGRALAYLYRKFSNSHGIYPNTPERTDKPSTRVGVIFDDLNTVNYSQNDLAKLQSLKRTVVVDFNGFETGVNFLDYAIGPQRVSRKIQSVIDKVERARREQPGASDEQLIAGAIKGPIAQLAARVNGATEVISADAVPLRGRSMPLEPASMDPVEAARRISEVVNTPFATAQTVTEFLTRSVPDNQAPLSYIMANGTARLTWRDLSNYAQNLHAKLMTNVEKTTPASGLADINFVDSHSAKSDALVNFLYRTANDIPRDRFGFGAARNLVFLDDKIYSGQQMGREIGYRMDIKTVENIYAAALVSGGGPMLPHNPHSKVAVRGISGGPEPPVATAKDWRGASKAQTERAEQFEEQAGVLISYNHNDLTFGDDPGHMVAYYERIVLPYGVPDNDIPAIREFSHRVLGSQDMNIAEGKPLPPGMQEYAGKGVTDAAARQEFLETGDVNVDTSRTHGYEHHYKATVTKGNRSVYAHAYKDDSSGYARRMFEPGMKLANMMNLSTFFPQGVSRTFEGKKYWVTEAPPDIWYGDDFLGRLRELSGPSADARGKDTYKIVREDAELRQQIEANYLETLISGRSDPLRLSGFSLPDGRTQSTSMWMGARTDSKYGPGWGHFNDGLQHEYAKYQISTRNYVGLRDFYMRHLVEPTGIQQLRDAGYTGKEIIGILNRTEWFLEHRRFPAMGENS